MTQEAPVSRVVAYIDGFNLFFGLKSKGWKRYYWLDLPLLMQTLLKPHQGLEATHYFTARIRRTTNNHAERQRQNTYLDALGTQPGLFIHYGHYLPKPRKCRACGSQWTDYEEKMTDVNIATRMLLDAYDRRFDTAFLVSADSDLTMPVRELRCRLPQMRTVVVLPPGRHSVELTRAAHGFVHIGEDKLRHSQLPLEVYRKDGFKLQRPEHWH